VPVRLRWASRDADAVGFWLWKSVDGRRWRFVPVPNPSAQQAVLALRKRHRYRFLIHAYDEAGNASPAAFRLSFALSVLDDRSPQIAYRRRWRHGRATSGRASARLSFTGRGIAWVSRTGPTGGRARILVDGRYVGTVGLYSPTTVRRAIVFSKSWRRKGRHSVAVRPAGGVGRTPVDAFVLLR
jgi:hypothetical protein